MSDIPSLPSIADLYDFIPLASRRKQASLNIFRAILSLVVSFVSLLVIITNWYGIFRSLFVFDAIFLGVVFLILLLFEYPILTVIVYFFYYIKYNRKHFAYNTFFLPSRQGYAIGIMIPLFIMSISFFTPLAQASPTPVLFISDNIGSEGIPDIDAYYYSHTKELISCQLWNEHDATPISYFETVAISKHIYKFVDLMPNTTYFYSLSVFDKEYNFTTGMPESCEIAIFSDLHFGATTLNVNNIQKAVNILRDENKIRYLFDLGDVVNIGASDNAWQQYQTMFSPLLSSVPSRHCLGNHDETLNGHASYRKYVAPNVNGTPYSNNNYCQKVQIASNVYVFLLDIEWDMSSMCDAEYDWVDEELSKTDASDWVLIMSHYFFFAPPWSFEDTYSAELHETAYSYSLYLQDNYHIDAFFAGHNHNMRYYPDLNQGTGFLVGSFSVPSTIQEGFTTIHIDGDTMIVDQKSANNTVVHSYAVTNS